MDTNNILRIEKGELFELRDHSVESINIPDGVIRICLGAFHHCHNLRIVYIPESVKIIGSAAFCYCDNLQSVVFLGDENRSIIIEESAFKGCTSLSSINLPKKVSLGRDVFTDCPSIGKSISVVMNGKHIVYYSPTNQSAEYVIPTEVTIIDKYAFIDCTSLQSVIIPEGLEQIDDFAFEGCTSLQKLFIPKSVTEIGRMAFRGCDHLKSIDVDKDNERYLSYNGILFDHSLMSIIRFPPDIPSVTHVDNIPYYVRQIGSGAFSGCKYLKSIVIPISVTYISDFAFSDCESLENVTIIGNISEISDLTFSGCKSLKSITFPESITEIGEGAFCDCTSLESILLPQGVKSILSSAFYGCTSLHSVFIPNSVSLIDGDDLGYGFYGSFKDCTSLHAIHCSIINPSLIEIGEHAFDGVPMDTCTLYVPCDSLEEYRKHPVFGLFKHIEVEKTE